MPNYFEKQHKEEKQAVFENVYTRKCYKQKIIQLSECKIRMAIYFSYQKKETLMAHT